MTHVRLLLLLVAGWGAGAACAQTQPAVAVESRPTESALERARAAEARGDHAQAVVAFRAAIAEHPEDPTARRGLVRCLAQQGAVNDALDAAEDALKALPKDVELLALMARTLKLKAEELERGGAKGAEVVLNLEDAVQVARRALKLDAGCRDARLVAAQSLWQLGRPEEALVEAEQAMQRHPEHPGGFLVAGEVAMDRFLVKHRAITPELPEADRKKLEIEREAFFLKAEELFTKAAHADDARALPWRRLGDLWAWKDKQDAQVLRQYTEALARDPESGAPHDYITGRFAPEVAVKLYRDAATLRGKRMRDDDRKRAALLTWYQGLHQFRGKDWKAASKSFEAAYQANPAFLNSLYYMGRAAWLADDRTGARHWFSTFAAKAPVEFAELLRSLGNEGDVTRGLLQFLAAEANRERKLAESRDLNQVLALYRNTADDWNNYAFLCRETGQYEASYTAYRRALELTPEDPSLINDCAVILQYHLLRDLDQAKKMYEQVIELAKKVVLDPKSNAEQRARAIQSAQDAAGNLAKMK